MKLLLLGLSRQDATGATVKPARKQIEAFKNGIKKRGLELADGFEPPTC